MKTQKQAIIDFFVLMSGHVAGTAVSVGFSILTTRFLAPADYGLVASQLFLLSIFGWISDWGLEQALLSWSEKNFNLAASTHLTMRIISGITPFFWLTPQILGLKAFQTNSAVFALLAGSFFCQKVGMTYKTVLEKQGKLKRLATLEFFCSASGVLCAFFMALNGFGALSLAGQLLLERFLLMTSYAFTNSSFIVPKFSRNIAANFLTSFGLASSVSATFGLAVYDFMPFLLDKVCSAHQAGLYARSFSIATMPLMVTAVFGRISNTVYSQNQFQAATLSKWFCSLQVCKAALIIPAQFFLILTCPWWSSALFAGKWAGFAKVYPVLAVYGLIRAFYDDATNLVSVGFKNPWEFSFNQAIHALLIIFSAPACVYVGQAAGAGAIMSLSMGIVTARFWLIIFDYLGLSPKLFFQNGLATLYSGATEFVRSGPINLFSGHGKD